MPYRKTKQLKNVFPKKSSCQIKISKSSNYQPENYVSILIQNVENTNHSISQII